MKKIVLIISTLLLTACFGETGKGYITKECKKIENINGFNMTTKVILKSKEGKLTNLTIIENYEETENITNIQNSKKSEQNLYKTINGIDMNLEANTFTYLINTLETTDFIKEKFNIKEEQYKMLDYYKEIGYECN